MTTTAQAVRAVNHQFNIRNAGLFAGHLKSADLIQKSQGQALDLPEKDIVKIVLATMIGFATTKNPNLVDDYYNLKSPSGSKLGESVEHFIANPADLFEISISNATPAAQIIYRGPDRPMETELFTGPEIAIPGFSRTTGITGDCWQRLSRALRFPDTSFKSRRRRRHRTYK